MKAEEILAALADLVIERMERTAPAAEGVYDGFHLPPDCPSRERFNRLVKELPGATRRGRLWSVPRASWELARAAKKPETAREIAVRNLTRQGFRKTA